MACIPLPPAPAPGPPAPAPPPVPTPPPYVPPPGSPPALPPSAPPGTPQVVIDIANSYFQPDAYCYGGASIPAITKASAIYCGLGGYLTVAIQNISGTAPGTMNLRVSADNTNVRVTADHSWGLHDADPIVSHADATVTVPAGNVVLTDFSIDATAAGPGAITITVDNGTGTFSFTIITIGPIDCSPGG